MHMRNNSEIQSIVCVKEEDNGVAECKELL